MEIDINFWKDKRVFLTGHTGFKGAWMSLWLQDCGAVVTGYSLPPPTEPSLFNLANVASGMNSVFGDIRDLEAMKKALRESNSEIVFHMAAQSLVIPSYESPVDTYMTNVMGTVNLLEAVRDVKTVRSVVVVTSDKCYENKEWIWPYRENEAMGGYDPYSNSKGCAELVTSGYRRSFFSKSGPDGKVCVATARAGNVIGGGDWAAYRLVPDILNSFSIGKKVSIRNPNATRPWQHVLEPIRGYMILAEKLYTSGFDFADGWNFGPSLDNHKPVLWLMRKMKELWGEPADFIVENDSYALHEANHLMLDSSKANRILGWNSKWSLSKSLDEVVTWHKSYLEKQDMRSISMDQIRAYMREKNL